MRKCSINSVNEPHQTGCPWFMTGRPCYILFAWITYFTETERFHTEMLTETCSTFNSQMFLNTSSQAYWAKFNSVQFISIHLSIHFDLLNIHLFKCSKSHLGKVIFFVWFLLLQLDPVVRWSQMSENSRNNCFSFQIAQASLSLVSFIPFFFWNWTSFRSSSKSKWN